MKLTLCTLTGVDSETDINRVVALSRRFDFVEWGFLYSPTNQGKPGRYMASQRLRGTLKKLDPCVKVALHVCGSAVTDLVYGRSSVVLDLVNVVQARGGRIQLNFNAERATYGAKDVASLLARLSPTQVVIQYNEANSDLCEQLMSNCSSSNVAFLFDSSGGSGTPCKVWPEPLRGACGYAGGLGPGLMTEALDEIKKVAEGRDVWIDMEGKLRVEKDGMDWLSLDRCEQVLAEVDGWVNSYQQEKYKCSARVVVEEVAGSLEAAFLEGLEEALRSTNDETLRDLVERRLIPAMVSARTYVETQ